jgi:hypothetical protein
MIIIAVAILIAIGFVHSYLGERYILIRFFKRDSIPHLFGGDEFTKGTLRFCWHTISLAAFGFPPFYMTFNQIVLTCCA